MTYKDITIIEKEEGVCRGIYTLLKLPNCTTELECYQS